MKKLPLAAAAVAGLALASPTLAQTSVNTDGPLTIVAVLVAKPGKEMAMRDALYSLVAPTRQQAGNINYDMLVDNQHPGTVIFYENWKTKALWDAHMKSDILVDFARKQPDLAQSWKLYQMTRQP